jgi:YtkA-like
MALREAPPDVRPATRPDGAHPLRLLAGTLATVLVVTFVVFKIGGGPSQDVGRTAAPAVAKPVSTGTCGVPTPADATYSADVASDPDPPVASGANFTFTVLHGGKAVTGAKVCLAADMPAMQHPGITYLLTESSAGRYGARMQFSMSGAWRASLTVAEPGMPVVSVTVDIQVEDGGD